MNKVKTKIKPQSKDCFKDNLVIQQKKTLKNVIWALPKQWSRSTQFIFWSVQPINYTRVAQWISTLGMLKI
jgi:hypothetical protein